MKSNLIFLLSSILLGACGQVMLKLGVNRLANISLAYPEIFQTITSIFTNVYVVSGILCFVSSMILWIKVLANMELSKAYPSVSLSYPIVFFLSIILFDESLSLKKFLGLTCVSVGVYLLHI